MKAKMKAGDIIAISSNKWIKWATVSKWTHIAIAISDELVVEVLFKPNKVRVIKLEECIKNAKEAMLFKRSEALDMEKQKLLSSYVDKLATLHSPYGFGRMFYAGLIPFFRNLFGILAFFAMFLTYLTHRSEIVLFAILFAAFFPLSYLIQKFASRKDFLDKLRKLYIPEKWIEDLPGQFCSQLVVDLDAVIGGELHKKIMITHEPRPKDVVDACLKLGYEKCLLPNPHRRAQ